MQTITVQTVLDWLDGIAPFDSAEGYDNVGLLVGDPAAEVQGVVFCVDLTVKTVDFALAQGAQLVISHHPLMFGGVTRIHYTEPEGQALRALMANGLHFIAAHTNLDCAQGGTSDALAAALGLCGCMQADEYVRVGELPAAMTGQGLAGRVQDALCAQVRSYGAADQPITRVAVGAGAYGAGAKAALEAGAQAYVVGECKHHELLFACGQRLVVVEAGHFATELPGMAALFQRFLAAAAQSRWQVAATLFSQAPFEGATMG